MKCRLNNDPLMQVYNILSNNILEMYGKVSNKQENVHTDKTLETMLRLNGAVGNFLFKSYQLCDEYIIELAYYTEPKDDDRYLDYVNVYGTGHIVIFMHYFCKMNTEFIDKPIEEMTIDEKASFEIGNSNEYAAIIDIVNFIISLLGFRAPSTSIQAKINTTVPIYIASKILNSIRPICEQDVEGYALSFDDIKQMVNDSNNKKVFLGCI